MFGVGIRYDIAIRSLVLSIKRWMAFVTVTGTALRGVEGLACVRVCSMIIVESSSSHAASLETL